MTGQRIILAWTAMLAVHASALYGRLDWVPKCRKGVANFSRPDDIIQVREISAKGYYH